MLNRWRDNIRVVRFAGGRFIGLAGALVVSACAASIPEGPRVMALPAQGKSFDAFQQDDATCRMYAGQQVGAEAQEYIQDRYDTAYTQCMYSRGDTVQSAPNSSVYSASPRYYQTQPNTPSPQYTGPLGPTVAVMPSPSKPFDVFQQDQAICKQFAEGQISDEANSSDSVQLQQSYDLAYSQCMYSRGNQVPGYAYVSPLQPPAEQLDNSPSTFPRDTYPTPGYVPSPSPAPERTNDSAANIFCIILNAHQELILLAAHPSGIIDSTNVTIEQSGANGAIVIDSITWHAKRNFQTTLRFTLSYDSEGAVESVNIGVEENNDPFPAFLAADMAKQAVSHYASNKLKNSAAKVAIKVINSNTNIKQGLELFLNYLVNNPQES